MSSFLQNKNCLNAQNLIYNTSRLVRISLLISAINKEFASFSRESYFIKTIEKFLLCLHSLI